MSDEDKVTVVKIKGLIIILRPVNCLMMGGAVLIGELIAYETLFIALPALLGFITSFSLTGASMVVNDFLDRFVDMINAPTRPIPSQLVSEKAALLYAGFLSMIGLTAAYFTNLSCLAIGGASLIVSVIYSYKGKEMGLIGNFMVSFCVTLPLFYGGFLYNSFSWSSSGLLSLAFYTLMAFLANTGREITKGIMDTEGDKLRNVRSIALQFGDRLAANLAGLFYLLVVGLSIFPWVLDIVSWHYLPFVIISDLGFIISSVKLMKKSSRENAKKGKKMVLLSLGIGLIAIIAGRIGANF
jgi:4-hydroxybenzoate polyprenyltransferase